MVGILERTFGNEFSLMTVFEFQFKFPWSLVLRVQFAITILVMA